MPVFFGIENDSAQKLLTAWSIEKDESGESGPSLRHLNSLFQDVPDSGPHRVEAVGGIHHEICALALFGIGQLPRQDGVELLYGHIIAGENPLTLNFRCGCDHHHRIDAFLASSLIP